MAPLRPAGGGDFYGSSSRNHIKFAKQFPWRRCVKIRTSTILLEKLKRMGLRRRKFRPTEIIILIFGVIILYILYDHSHSL